MLALSDRVMDTHTYTHTLESRDDAIYRQTRVVYIGFIGSVNLAFISSELSF